MKKATLIIGILILTTSCVSKKLYQELETKYNKLRTSNAELIQEKESLLVSKNNLEKRLAQLEAEHEALKKKLKTTDEAFQALQSAHDKLKASYDALSTQSSEKLAAQAEENQRLLTALENKEKALIAESERLANLQSNIDEKSREISALRELIASKEAQMAKLKNSISNALHNFEGKGLTVEHKNGKVYVSMENKLLFRSGSWAVGAEGKQAVEQLAVILADNRDIDVLIEGHTDNVPYTGNTLEDNWDLSVKRATAIVRILKSKGVDPTQITAAGRSEYLPVSTNETTEGKAKNRRIEIILAPNLDEVSKLLNE